MYFHVYEIKRSQFSLYNIYYERKKKEENAAKQCSPKIPKHLLLSDAEITALKPI